MTDQAKWVRCTKSKWCLSDDGHKGACRGPFRSWLACVARLAVVTVEEFEKAMPKETKK